ncbi:MAG: hypothetical protein AMXMBFR49_10480 [Chlorobiota bacterium]
MKKILLIPLVLLPFVVNGQWQPVNVKLSGYSFAGGTLYTDTRIALLSTGSNVFFKSFDDGRSWAFDSVKAGYKPVRFAAALGGMMVGVEQRLSSYHYSNIMGDNWYRYTTSGVSTDTIADIEASLQDVFYFALPKNLYTKPSWVNWLVQLDLPLSLNEEIRLVEGFWETGELFVATSTGRVLKTRDQGTSWTEILRVNAPITALETKGFDNLYICTEGTPQRIFTSPNRGTTWDSSLVAPFNISEIYFFSPQKAIARSTANRLFITSDSMRTWRPGPSITVFRMGVTRGENGLIITPTYEIYLTSNAGESWELSSELNTSAIRGIEVLPDNSAYAFTATGNIYRSGDFGLTWKMIHDSLSTGITHLTRESDTSLLAFEPGGTVLRYNAATGAITDISATFPSFDQPIYEYGNTLFAIRNKSRLHFSVDYGLTWTSRNIPDSAIVNFFFATGSFFYIASNNGTFYESSDRGTTWSSKRLSTIQNDNLHFIYRNGLRMWAASTISRMFFSDDGGATWLPANYRATRKSFYCHKNFWLMQISSVEMVQTTDEGRTWKRTLHYPNSLDISSIKINSRNFGLMLDTQGRIYLMRNNGVPVELTSFNSEVVPAGVHLSWETATETNNYGFYLQRRNGGVWSDLAFIPGKGTTLERNTYSWLDDLKPQKGDTNFYRLKQVDHSGEFSYSYEVAVGFSPYTLELDQNFPNPFTLNGVEGGNRTLIRFRLPEDGHGSLRVFDARGRLVEELYNGYLGAGEHTYPFPSPGVSPASGVYFYELRFNGSVRRGKMLLLR